MLGIRQVDLSEVRLCQRPNSPSVHITSSCLLSQVGHSQPSAIAMLRTGFTVPKCPGAPRVTGATKSTVTLAWKAPEETGGSQVIDYEAEIQPKSRAAMEGGKADDWMLVYQVRTADMIIVSCVFTP